MDALKELVKIVNRKRLSKIDVFDKTFLNQNNSNLYYKLYEGLESGKLKMILQLQNIYTNRRKDAKFRKLKSRFKNKFLNQYFYLISMRYLNNEKVEHIMNVLLIIK
jgi:hypothetical protein